MKIVIREGGRAKFSFAVPGFIGARVLGRLLFKGNCRGRAALKGVLSDLKKFKKLYPGFELVSAEDAAGDGVSIFL